jgi:nicotinate phosphoribosyltransferase
VGTRLATAYDDPALGGVYKLSAIRQDSGAWEYKIKLSDDPTKGSTPGILQVRRFEGSDGRYLADAIYNEPEPPKEEWKLIDPSDPAPPQTFPAEHAGEDLLVPVFRGGRRVYDPPPIEVTRGRTLEHLSKLDGAVKHLTDPEQYPVRLEAGLLELKTKLAATASRPG